MSIINRLTETKINKLFVRQRC